MRSRRAIRSRARRAARPLDRADAALPTPAAVVLTAIGCAAPTSLTGDATEPVAAATPTRSAGADALTDQASLFASVYTPGVVSSERWTFGQHEGVVLRTAHYRIFTTESSSVLRDRVADFLERALAHYRTAAVDEQPLPPPRLALDTYLMDDRSQWASLTRRLLRDQADTALAIGRGGYATRGIGAYFDIGLYDTLAVAAHEGWHQYTQRAFRQPLPIYLEEGLATFMEGHRWTDGVVELSPWANVERYDTLRDAFAKGRLLGVGELVGLSPQDLIAGEQVSLLSYYAQCWALVHFLEHGDAGVHRSGLVRLLRDAAEGRLDRRLREFGVPASRARNAVMLRRGSTLLDAYVLRPGGLEMNEFERRYADFVRELVGVGVRDRIVQGLAPEFVARTTNASN